MTARLSHLEKLRRGVIRAANFIGKHPKVFNFHETAIPQTCKSPGCVLGWIHHFTKMPGEPSEQGDLIDAPRIFGSNVTDSHFYLQMNQLNASGRWTYDATVCARTLRKYVKIFMKDPIV